MLKSIAFYNDSLNATIRAIPWVLFHFYFVPRPTLKSNTPIDKEPNLSAHNKNKSNISFWLMRCTFLVIYEGVV